MERETPEARRRRLIRMGAIVAALVAIVALVLITPFEGGDDVEEPARNEEAAGPCNDEQPPEASAQQYDAPPPLELPAGVDYSAVIHTNCGDIAFDLLEDKAPQTVASFVFLAREGFYDGISFHRVEASVIQFGDPNGQNGEPPDGPGYTVPDEFPEQANEYVYGVVGLANAGPGSGGSQVFIVTHDREGGSPAGYPPFYTIFGEVDSASFDVLDEIATLETKGGNDPVEAVKPVDPVFITSIEITEA